MAFIVMDELEKETVTPKYSTAFGETITGVAIELARLRFEKGTGAVEHAHPQEQIMYVISGKLRVRMGGEEADLGPGAAFHAGADVPHQVTAVEDTLVISCKAVIEGVGHKF